MNSRAVLTGKSLGGDHHHRRDAAAGDRDEIAGFVADVLVHQVVVVLLNVQQQQGVAILGRLRHQIGCDHGRGARFVLHDHRLPQFLGEQIGQDACADLDAHPRPEARHDLDRFDGEVLRLRRSGCGQGGRGKHDRGQVRGDESHAFSPDGKSGDPD